MVGAARFELATPSPPGKLKTLEDKENSAKGPIGDALEINADLPALQNSAAGDGTPTHVTSPVVVPEAFSPFPSPTDPRIVCSGGGRRA